MDLAALVISVVALLASGAAAWYTRQQAIVGKRQAVAAEEANAALRAVDWVLAPEIDRSDDSWMMLGPLRYAVRHTGRGPVTDVRVVLGVDPHGAAGGVATSQTLAPGEPLTMDLRMSATQFLGLPKDALYADITWTDALGSCGPKRVELPGPW